ncbi:MAG: YqgE/AlgH family protein [Planctomycetales bacterium]|nr:YqgE/AlgH family protein [Planctomycetales bacterium]
MKSLTGQFLVASPHLKDPNFARTVVLMLRHNEEGALGVILNRPGDKTVREVWELIDAEPCECDDDMFLGGPVPGPLIAVHDQPLLADDEVLPGVYMAMQREPIDQLVREAGAEFRLFSGHSGWGSGQLEGELEAGGWLLGPATVAEIFGDVEPLWRNVCNRIGRNIAAPGIKPDAIPDDPELN